MTNTLAAILITVSTNWTTIGYYYPKEGTTYQDVQEGRLSTNFIAILDWNGKKHEMLLEQLPGPSIGERKLPMPIKTWSNNPTNWFIPNPGWSIQTNWLTQTNMIYGLSQ